MKIQGIAVNLLVSIFFLLSVVSAGSSQEISSDKYITLLRDTDILNDQEAIDGLVAIGPSVVDTLVPLLADAKRDMKAAIVEALGRIGDPKAFEPLKNELEMLKYMRQKAETFADSYIRIMVIKALGDLGDKRALPLLHKVTGSTDIYEQTHAYVSLDKLGDENALPHLEKIMSEDDANCRNIVIIAQARKGNTKAIPMATAALTDSVWFIRASACDTLATIGDSSALPQLEPMLKDSSPYVRQAAQDAIDALKK